ALISDGDIMEGISHETASLAGHLGLGKLIALYDSNDISLDGDLDRSFSENTEERFKAYGWEVIRVEDGNDTSAIKDAIERAKQNESQPTLIEVKTIIGYGSPNKSDSSASHGAPLGEDESKLTKENYEWDYEPFEVPQSVYDHYHEKIVTRGAQKEEEWNELFAAYEKANPQLAEELTRAINNELPTNWDEQLPTFESGEDTLATRAASG